MKIFFHRLPNMKYSEYRELFSWAIVDYIQKTTQNSFWFAPLLYHKKPSIKICIDRIRFGEKYKS